MDSDSDEFDYLSHLKSGFNTNTSITKSSFAVIESVDTDSDTNDLDSDDCVIIECVNTKNGKTADKPKEESTKSLAKEHNKVIIKESSSDCVSQKKEYNDKWSQKLDSYLQNVKHLRDNIESKTETSVKTESFDVKPVIRAPDFDIKPFVLKIENEVEKQESLELKEIKNKGSERNASSSESTLSNIESIGSADFGSRDSFSTSGKFSLF